MTFWGSFYEYLLPSVPLCQWAQGSHPPSEGRSWSGTGMANLPQRKVVCWARIKRGKIYHTWHTITLENVRAQLSFPPLHHPCKPSSGHL